MARSDARSEAPTEHKFLLKLVDAKDADRVSQTVKQWNSTIRERLRSATGLKLSTADDRQAVPVRVNHGLPKPFSDLVGAQPDFALWWLTARRPSLTQAAAALKEFEENYANVVSPIHSYSTDREIPVADEAAIAHVRELIEGSLRWAEERALLEKFKLINTDVLGAYFYNQSHIRLYWIVIAIVSRMIDVEVEDLTIVVMAHELAHAYTHLGKDIDGKEWETMAFAKSDLRIIEGAAQVYTHFVCHELAERQPGAEKAFNRLLEHQSDIYTDFQHWVDDRHQRRAGEIIRFALVDYRSRIDTRYDDFRALVDDIAAKLSQ